MNSEKYQHQYTEKNKKLRKFFPERKCDTITIKETLMTVKIFYLYIHTRTYTQWYKLYINLK